LADRGARLVNPHPLTTDQYFNVPGAWTADSGSVIFYSQRLGNPGIYKQGLDGNAPQAISSAHLDTFRPLLQLSPDGSWVIFAGGTFNAPTGTPVPLYRVSVNGGAPQRLFEVVGLTQLFCTNRAAGFCAYGTLAEEGREMVVTAFDPLGGKGKELVRIPTEPGSEYQWALSPNGSQVAVWQSAGRENQIRFIPLHGGETRAITVKEHLNLYLNSLSWAPDSKSLFVAPAGDTFLNLDLKGTTQQVLQVPQGHLRGGLPSPDGRHLAMRWYNWDANVWMIDNF